jgi:hypothetical protein
MRQKRPLRPIPTPGELFDILANRAFLPSYQYNFSEDYGRLVRDLRYYGYWTSVELCGNIEIRVVHIWIDNDFNKLFADYKRCVDAFVDFVGDIIANKTLDIHTATILLKSLESTQRCMRSVVAKDATHYRDTLDAFIKAIDVYTEAPLYESIKLYPIPVAMAYTNCREMAFVDIIEGLAERIEVAYSSTRLFDRRLGDQWFFIRLYCEAKLALARKKISSTMYSKLNRYAQLQEHPPEELKLVSFYGTLMPNAFQ